MIPLEDEPKEFTIEEYQRYVNTLNKSNDFLKSTIRVNVILGIVTGLVIAGGGHLLKLVVDSSINIVGLFNYLSVAFPFLFFGGNAFNSSEEIDRNNLEIERVSKIIRSKEQAIARGEVKEPEHVITEREYEEIIAKKNGYVRGADPEFDKIFDHMLDEHENRRNELLERSKKARGDRIKPINDDVIPSYDDDYIPPELTNPPKRR